MNNENIHVAPIWRRGDEIPDNWPRWLREADIEWCRAEVTDGAVVWHAGEWRGGLWFDGRWYDGTWHEGTWHEGEWCGGTWHAGTWHSGIWHDGHWYDGTWHSGTWYEGEWRAGTWHSGEWHEGEWYGGEWHGGTWCDGFWHDGSQWHAGGPPGSGSERMGDIVDIDFLGVHPRVLSRGELSDTLQVSKDTYLQRYRTDGDSIVIDLGRGRQITIKVNQRVGGGVSD